MNDKSWLKLVFVALLLNVATFPLARYVNSFGIISSIIVSIYFILAFITIFLYLLASKSVFNISKRGFYLVLIISILMTLLNLAVWEAVIIAPNIGYPLLITNSAMVFVTIYSGLVNKEELSLRRYIAVFLIFVGVVMVIL